MLRRFTPGNDGSIFIFPENTKRHAHAGVWKVRSKLPQTAFNVLGGCSLLGAVRSDDLIPWTNDVDIAVPAYVLSKLMVCLLLRSSLYLSFRQSLPITVSSIHTAAAAALSNPHRFGTYIVRFPHRARQPGNQRAGEPED